MSLKRGETQGKRMLAVVVMPFEQFACNAHVCGHVSLCQRMSTKTWTWHT